MNDLNTAAAIGNVQKLLSDTSISDSEKRLIIDYFDGRVLCLGLFEQEDSMAEIQIPEDVINLAEQRKQARVEKRWQDADTLREKIATE